LTLLDRVCALLAHHGIDHAIIGAAALAAHGVARATMDLDLLATDPACLDERVWEDLRSTGADRNSKGRIGIPRGQSRGIEVR
jgi:hypothetical protein